jgi:hypothetical protein
MQRINKVLLGMCIITFEIRENKIIEITEKY